MLDRGRHEPIGHRNRTRMTTRNARPGRLRPALLIAGFVGLLLTVLPTAPVLATAAAGESTAIEQIIVEELAQHPGGGVVGNEIRYDDGLVFVAVLPGTNALSQCPSGRFCGWSNTNFQGSFYSVTGSGLTALAWTALSYSNNRATIARLRNSSDTAGICFAPGEARASVEPAYYNPSKVRLAAATSC
ncbi:peptidase inhibitor family I36 protein [Nocardioides sp.]|uniref:peptidase inhibitor family I36 protein n=1 Tax=Nocardioides sp. TaxID=35761 RepID=UPI0039E481A9